MCSITVSSVLQIIGGESDPGGARYTARPTSAAFNRELYAKRNVVERCVGRHKQWRGLATRYEKRAINYRAVVVIAALIIWLSL